MVATVIRGRDQFRRRSQDMNAVAAGRAILTHIVILAPRTGMKLEAGGDALQGSIPERHVMIPILFAIWRVVSKVLATRVVSAPEIPHSESLEQVLDPIEMIHVRVGVDEAEDIFDIPALHIFDGIYRVVLLPEVTLERIAISAGEIIRKLVEWCLMPRVADIDHRHVPVGMLDD